MRSAKPNRQFVSMERQSENSRKRGRSTPETREEHKDGLNDMSVLQSRFTAQRSRASSNNSTDSTNPMQSEVNESLNFCTEAVSSVEGVEEQTQNPAASGTHQRPLMIPIQPRLEDPTNSLARTARLNPLQTNQAISSPLHVVATPFQLPNLAAYTNTQFQSIPFGQGLIFNPNFLGLLHQQLQQLQQGQQPEIPVQATAVNQNVSLPLRVNTESTPRPALTPRPYDVVLGRGRKFRYNPGNVRMHLIVSLYRETYGKGDRETKASIRQNIVSFIKFQSGEKSGRFLKFDKRTNHWFEIPDGEALDKVGHAIRDGSDTVVPMNTNDPRLKKEIDDLKAALQLPYPSPEEGERSSELAEDGLKDDAKFLAGIFSSSSSSEGSRQESPGENGPEDRKPAVRPSGRSNCEQQP